MALRRWTIRILLACTLAVALGYLPYRAYGPNGLTRSLRLERQLHRLNQHITQLKQDNATLRQQIQGLKDDRLIIERVARDELGLVRPEDVVFLLQ